MKKTLVVLALLIILVLFANIQMLFGPVAKSETVDVFTVPQNTQDFDTATELFRQKFIKNRKAFQFLLNTFAKNKEPKPGGYNLSPNMNAWVVMEKITGQPDLVWVTLSYCPRKEQVGEKLAEALDWTDSQMATWNNLYKTNQSEYFEGVYYPDTYLIPVTETPTQVAQRMIDRFNEKFAPLSGAYIAQNIKWTTGLKIASLIAREAAGKSDMKLISGVIWNRLNTDMRLQIDSTMQYTLGKRNGSWWGPVDISEKRNDSPYNTYLHEGLPPTPICSPNIDYLEVVINPQETDCIYYLHDNNQQIHCAKTYKEHLVNIKIYLQN